MAITQVNVSTPAVEIIYTDTAIGNALDAIKASSAKLYYVIVDNSANVAATYVKLFNVASGSVTLGTTAPDEVIYVPASSVITHMLFTGAAPGKTFGTALTAAAVTTGGTAGTTPPSSSVIFTASYV
jgi:hypothetical protein